jgi:hypothetical protein
MRKKQSFSNNLKTDMLEKIKRQKIIEMKRGLVVAKALF